MSNTVTQISRTEIPDYLRKYQEEILERAQALGKDDGFVLPEYNVAGRSGLQQQASDLTASGLGAYAPMLQAGTNTLGAGIGTMYGATNPLNQAMGSIGGTGQAISGIQGAVGQGYSGLAGTGAQFDPSNIQQFMDPYEDQAVQQAMTDIRRQGDQQRSGIDAQATAAGAMGGSRQAVRQGQLDESILNQQGRTAAGMRQAGYQGAAQRAQQAYEQSMGRQQRAALSGAQMGIQGGQASGQLGLGAGSAYSGLAGQYGSLGRGLGSLGLQQAQLGETAQGLGFKDINMLSTMGGQEQAQQQAMLDAQRQNQYQNVMAPYQQLGFYSDIYQGMPTAQQTFSQQQQPSPSAISQIAGLGMGLYGLQQSNMFGGSR